MHQRDQEMVTSGGGGVESPGLRNVGNGPSPATSASLMGGVPSKGIALFP